MHFMAVIKYEKTFWFFIYSYLKRCIVLTYVGMRRGYHLLIEHTKRIPFVLKIKLYTAKSKKVALAIGHWVSGHMEQCIDLLELLPNNSFKMRNSQCPKQPSLNQLYKRVRG